MIMGAVVSAAGAVVLALGRRRLPGALVGAPVGAPALPRGDDRGIRPGVWIGIVQVVVGVAIMPLWSSSTTFALGLSLFGLFPSGAMFIVLLRAKGSRLSALRYRLVVAIVALVFVLVAPLLPYAPSGPDRADMVSVVSDEYSLLMSAAAERGRSGPDAEAVASMIVGDARVECDIVKEEYAEVKTRVDDAIMGVASGGSYGGEWDAGVTLLYSDECLVAYVNKDAPGDRNVPYRMNDMVRAGLMMYGAFPLDCEILRYAHGDAGMTVDMGRLGFPPPDFMSDLDVARDKAVWSFYKSMKASGDC